VGVGLVGHFLTFNLGTALEVLCQRGRAVQRRRHHIAYEKTDAISAFARVWIVDWRFKLTYRRIDRPI
jgi:hypothetical protein